MLGSMYICDPTVWRSFYENMIEGKFNPGQYQAGREREVASLECMLRNLI